jgi:hypothetical protein
MEKKSDPVVEKVRYIYEMSLIFSRRGLPGMISPLDLYHVDIYKEDLYSVILDI